MGRILALFCAAALLLITVGGTMSKAEAQYICSDMSGVLLGADGAPAAGVEVRREWRYANKNGADTTVTDGQGRFDFAAVPGPRKGWLSGLSTPVVDQRFFVTEGGAETRVIFLNSRSLKYLHETGGVPFKVSCQLGGEPRMGPLGRGYCELVD